MVSSCSQNEEIEKSLSGDNLAYFTFEWHEYCSKNVSILREPKVIASVISVGVYICCDEICVVCLQLILCLDNSWQSGSELTSCPAAEMKALQIWTEIPSGNAERENLSLL